jgi:hypothetical protein
MTMPLGDSPHPLRCDGGLGAMLRFEHHWLALKSGCHMLVLRDPIITGERKERIERNRRTTSQLEPTFDGLD